MMRMKHDCRRRPWVLPAVCLAGVLLFTTHAYLSAQRPTASALESPEVFNTQPAQPHQPQPMPTQSPASPLSSLAASGRAGLGASILVDPNLNLIPPPPKSLRPTDADEATTTAATDTLNNAQPNADGTQVSDDRQAGPAAYCSDPKRHAFFFFGQRPDRELLEFASELAGKTQFDVHLVIDDKKYRWTSFEAIKYPRIRTHFVDAAWVQSVKMTHFGSSPSMGLGVVMALDKAVALAAYMEDDTLPSGSNQVLTSDNDGEVFVNATTGRPTRLRYCRTWFIESDTFIPSVAAAQHLDSLATVAGADFAGVLNQTYLADMALPKPMHWFHWNVIPDFLDETAETAAPTPSTPLPTRGGADHQQPPAASQTSPLLIAESSWACGMQNAFALTDRYLLKMRQLALDRGRLFFKEAFLPTMATHWRMTQWNPAHDELLLQWRLFGTPDEVNWQWAAMRSACTDPLLRCWFHPIKNQSLRRQHRRKVGQLERSAANVPLRQ